MASYALSGAEALTFSRGRNLVGFGFMEFSRSGICLPKMGAVSFTGSNLKAKTVAPRFLSIVYDHVINLGHWTMDMRDDALEPADLYDPRLRLWMLVVGLDSPHWASLGTYIVRMLPFLTSRHTSSRRQGRRKL
ncbi:hypothetical protein Cni_G13853 [Canna indica]|uniref:Uncharacterized protein n=1 Tax=Canna indica TaxID=4628 RepID=A0AAQ3QE53_9LILI|nr:hypothetical protein Cni_G13853 [Canna indica]